MPGPDALSRPTQTELGARGNCYQTCLAMLLGVPAADLPDQTAIREAGGDYEAAITAFLARRGLVLTDLPPSFGYLGRVARSATRGLHVMSGPGPRGRPHAVVGRLGSIWWDPHPSREGLLGVETWSVLEFADFA